MYRIKPVYARKFHEYVFGQTAAMWREDNFPQVAM
jgi:hypothetical protein